MAYDPKRALELLRIGSGRADAIFRDGQEDAIRHIVDGKGRLLVVQKTGWGKSFVYFIAIKLLREAGGGPALLISPLLALMRNQIAAAERMGVRAATINSDNQDEWKSVEAKLRRNEVDILLIAPEKLGNDWFNTEVLADIAGQISLMVIDEAIAFPIGVTTSVLTTDCWNVSPERFQPICGCWPQRQQQTIALWKTLWLCSAPT